MMDMDEGLERSAMERHGFLVVVETPGEQLSAVVSDVQLDLLGSQCQPWVQLLIDKSELYLELFPKLLVDLRKFTLGVRDASTGLELVKLFLALEANFVTLER